jgi:Phospholipase_D-nuclease N-terminal
MIAATTATWVFILIPLIVIWVLSVVDILRGGAGRGVKAAWILIVIVLPILGTLLYWVLRRPTDREIRQVQAASRHHPGSDADTLGSHPRAGGG